jgi:hypothetical protein
MDFNSDEQLLVSSSDFHHSIRRFPAANYEFLIYRLKVVDMNDPNLILLPPAPINSNELLF